MIEVLKDFIVRILCGSIICFISLAVVGNGPHREAVRLCCAAIMIIIVFTNGKMYDIDLNYMNDVKDELQEDIYGELAKAKSSEVDQIISAIEKKLVDNMNKEGMYCSIKLLYDYDEDITITGVVVRNLSDTNNKNNVLSYLINNVDIEESAIIFE